MFSFSRRSAQVRRPRAQANPVSGLVQQLESRTLLAAITFTSSANSITVRGTTDGETINVSSNGTSFVVNGEDTGIEIAGRTNLTVNALEGDDTIILDASLNGVITKSTLNGGAGADSYTGAASDDRANIDELDTIGNMGAGYDYVVAVAGAGALNLVFTGTEGVEYVRGSDNADFIDLSLLTNNVKLLGQGGNDTLIGGSGNDSIYGGDGEDSLSGSAGLDKLYGDAGLDVMNGGANDDTIYFDAEDIALDFGAGLVGGSGWDAIRVSSISDPGVTLVLTDSNSMERVFATDNADSIDGSALTRKIEVRSYAGNDSVIGGSAGDLIYAGDDNDTVYGGSGNDTIDGQNGDDSIRGQVGNDSLTGGAGIDQIDYSDSLAGVTVRLFANMANDDGFAAGVDTLAGFEVIIGSNHDDSLYGDLADNLIYGGTGADYLDGREGNDGIDGGAGDDQIKGHDGDDTVNGGIGNDTIYGGLGSDTLNGNEDNDRIYAESLEVLDGGDGIDSLFAETASTTVVWNLGSSQFESVTGTNGDDIIDLTGSSIGTFISGRGGADQLTGGSGNDTIYGGNGNDTLIGGAGADTLRGDNDNDLLIAYLSANTDSDGFKDSLNGLAGTDVVWGNVSPDADTLIGESVNPLAP